MQKNMNISVESDNVDSKSTLETCFSCQLVFGMMLKIVIFVGRKIWMKGRDGLSEKLIMETPCMDFSIPLHHNLSRLDLKEGFSTRASSHSSYSTYF
jgi:hypothetical protein